MDHRLLRLRIGQLLNQPHDQGCPALQQRGLFDPRVDTHTLETNTELDAADRSQEIRVFPHNCLHQTGLKGLRNDFPGKADAQSLLIRRHIPGRSIQFRIWFLAQHKLGDSSGTEVQSKRPFEMPQ